ncbi:MAG: threonine/serine dehydratase [Anaerolineae bacterium]|nr:threonine/serine dehydratase [Anaerolineae bacterium]
MSQPSLDLSAILCAHRRIAPFIRRTPLVRSPYLSAMSGAEVWLKLECQQPTGSFKVRGALNKVGMLSSEERSRGIVTGSAGNHGLGVAHAARSWGGMQALVYVPSTAPRAKVDKMRYLGATVRQQGSTYEDAHQGAEAYARETGTTYVSAYDDVDVIAGQGTVGLEIWSELPETDLLLAPVGGGGLIAGVAVVSKTIRPEGQVIGVQPQASPAALLSLRDGTAYDPYDHEPTIADGLAGGFGAIPFTIARALIDDILLASEADLRRAIYTLIDHEQLIVEASGAIAIAPLLSGDLDAAGKTVVCILTGGNLDTDLLRDILVEFA